MTDCHLISCFAEEDRQKLQGLVVLGGEGLGRSFVELFRCVFVPTEECRGPGVGGASEGQRIGVPGEAVKLLLQLRLFLKEIWDITADAAIEHEDNHILSVPAEGEGGLLAGFPFSQLPDLRQFGPDSDNVVYGHPCHRENQDRKHRLQKIFLLPPQKQHRSSAEREDREVKKAFLP